MIKYDFEPKNAGSFNLYGHDDIDFEQTKENVLAAFKDEYENKIKTVLENLGLKYKGLSYYSPNAYNFAGDGLTLTISERINKAVFVKFLIRHRDELNEALGKNKSYDGYISESVDSVEVEVMRLISDRAVHNEFENPTDCMKHKYSPDCLILNWLINQVINFSDFDIYEFFEWDREDD